MGSPTRNKALVSGIIVPDSQSRKIWSFPQGAHDLIGQTKPHPQKVPETDGTRTTCPLVVPCLTGETQSLPSGRSWSSGRETAPNSYIFPSDGRCTPSSLGILHLSRETQDLPSESIQSDGGNVAPEISSLMEGHRPCHGTFSSDGRRFSLMGETQSLP